MATGVKKLDAGMDPAMVPLRLWLEKDASVCFLQSPDDSDSETLAKKSRFWMNLNLNSRAQSKD